MPPVEQPFESDLHPHIALTGESPVWDPGRNVLWWIDVQGQWLLGWSSDTGSIPNFPLPSQPGLVALTTSGDLIIGLEDGLWRYSPEAGSLDLLCPVEPDNSSTRINDGKPDRQGRLWFGTMEKHGGGAPVGGLYCFDPMAGLVQVRDQVRIPNAIAISPAGDRLYFADSPTGVVESWRIEPDRPALAEQSVLATYSADEKPDGAAVDENGDIWIAVVGGWRLDRITAAGARVAAVRLPVARPTMPAFGGRDGRSLFVTSQRRFLGHGDLSRQPGAGKLARLQVSVSGMAARRCRI
jgi:sugar lactone lactonase YvrE